MDSFEKEYRRLHREWLDAERKFADLIVQFEQANQLRIELYYHLENAASRLSAESKARIAEEQFGKAEK